jgi:uncharacterized membrane protein YgaE (UPF0421/DUF939 family)
MHPRVGLALRTAIAAGLAWLLAQALPEAAAGRTPTSRRWER